MKNTHLPSDLAVCFTANGESLTVASFSESGAIETQRFAVGENLHFSLKTWRDQLGHRTDLQTIFRFVPFLFTEQTHVAAVPEHVLQLEDRDLTLWLIDAANNQTSGEDGYPLFESSLQKSLYDYCRLPNGQISLTELPRDLMHDTLKKVMQSSPLDKNELARLTRYQPDESQPYLIHAVETRLRAMTRFLANSDREFFEASKEDETIAVFAFTPEGCGFSLWNPAQSFFAEFGENFNLNFDQNEVPDELSNADYVAQIYLEAVYNFLHEQFYKRINPEIERQTAMKVTRIYWAASNGLNEPLTELLTEFAEQTAYPLMPVNEVPIEEMVVGGLLLAYNEDAEALVPSINLANDISVQNESINAEQMNLKAVILQQKRNVALACMMLPVILAIGTVIGLWANGQRVSASLSWRESTASAEQARLKPILQARADYEKTLKWYEDVLRQIIGLRQKQTSSLSFAARLDPLYPPDGAFYVSEMKLAPGGVFELKGYTRDEMQVSQFVNSMEFATDDKERRYFTGLQLEFRQGSEIAGAATAGGAVNSGSTLGNLAPGVSAFMLKGNFAPAMVLKAQNPSAPNAANPQQPINPAQKDQSSGANSNPAVPNANNAGGAK